ncbi:type IV pilus biogenesis protein PilM [Sulfoacidibacillus thermotolerans]|uniref:SHS2 domain-containing protein n=1 Tax=Sulfoacidibacillus thermotolerans TaxID=1765684 RepID=A0A2U3DC16_SULT2|nr:hypothetical protein [Sulfoacidibacillus thermotolerans]PWI58837.1 hypothetical protein BM613_01730 [Sulfoacidibacillus thermotolerans]
MALLHLERPRSLPLGLDLNGDLFVVSELKFRSSKLLAQQELKKLVWRRLNEEGRWLDEEKRELFTETLAQVVKENHWKGRKVVVSAPSDHLLLRHLSLPSMSNRLLRLAVQTELTHSLQLPFEDPVYDFAVSSGNHVLSRQEGEQDIILLVLPREDVIRISDWIRAAGLRPIRMEPTLLAAQRMLGIKEVQSGLYAIVILRQYGAELGVFDRSDLIFLRQVQLLPADYGLYAESGIEESQLMGFASDMSHEIERSLNFFHYNVIQADSHIEHVYVFGSPFYASAVIAALQSRLEQTVQVISPQLGVLHMQSDADQKKSRGVHSAELLHGALVAAGLALSEVSQ